MQKTCALVAALLNLLAVSPAAGQIGTPLFRYFAFSAEDLEILPGQTMSLHGSIHANGDLYVNSESTSTLSVGDSAAVPLARVTAGGLIHRGRKNTAACGGTVQIDALRDVLPPAGDLDPVALACGAGGSRHTLTPEDIAGFEGSVTDGTPYVLPDSDTIDRGTGEYWAVADLRLALDLTSPDANGLYPIRVLTSADFVDTTLTPRLHAFMDAKPGRIFYNDVPRTTAQAAGTSCNPPASNTYCHPSAYNRLFSTANTGPGGAEQADVYPCVATDLNLYPSCSGTCSASSPPSCGTYMRTLYQNGTTGRTSRRGGFYNNREAKWVYMLNVNMHDLLAWNRAQTSDNRLFDPDDATTGGLVIFLTVKGPNSETPGTNVRYGVRVFGSPNLDFPTGSADPTGLTVVSDQSIYVEGHYNVDAAASAIYDSTKPTMPAAFIGDAINVLSSNWSGHNNATGFTSTRCRNDCQSRRDLMSRPGGTTYIDAAMLGGLDRTVGSDYGGGLESFTRFHESWTGAVLRYRGSFVASGPPRRANGSWCGTGGSIAAGCNIYNPPTRDWDFDPSFLDDALLPPATPSFITCGNGILDDGEACDGGNNGSGDCCSRTCTLEPAGKVCRAATDACDAAEVCDGASAACPADVVADDGTTCDDGDPCTTGDVCAAGACTAGVACGDGDVCTADVCTSTGCEYDATPATTCHAAATSTFALTQRDGASRTLRWKWMRGSSTLADFGAPTDSTAYTLCLYDADGLVLRGTVPPSSSLWRAASAKVWRYTDRTASAAGISKLDLAGSDAAGRARIALTGTGDALPDPDLRQGLSLPVTVQLRREDGPGCWTSAFEAPSVKKNDATRFDARVR